MRNNSKKITTLFLSSSVLMTSVLIHASGGSVGGMTGPYDSCDPSQFECAQWGGSTMSAIISDTPSVSSETNQFSVSLSETTDGGMAISSSFNLMDDETAYSEDAGFSLAFTDGSKLDVINAGNASGSHDVSIPGQSGLGDTSKSSDDNSGISMEDGEDVWGVEYHTAADFMADGLVMSISHGSDSGNPGTDRTDSHYAIGATYVTGLGDTAVTVGMAQQDDSSAADVVGHQVGFSAVTGDLTVAVGYADGEAVGQERSDSDVAEAGVQYVTGDLTVTIGIDQDDDSSAADVGGHHVGFSEVTGDLTVAIGLADGDADGQERSDSDDTASASVSYPVASGVTVGIGNTDVDNENTTDDDSDDGSAWYIGANMSF